MKWIPCVGGLALAAVAWCGCGRQPADAFKREYRLQVTVGPQTYWGMGAARFAELATEKTGGRVRVKPYFAGQLLKGSQLNAAQMVADGAIDVAFESTINTAPVVGELNLFSLPFFVRTFERLDRLEAGETGRRLFAAMEQKGLQPLAWGENGFRQVTNSRRPVRCPEDLRALKIRIVGSPIFIDIFRSLGADPINMNWSDAVTALQQGTVDGQENPIGILVSARIYQFQPHVTLWNYVVDPLVIYWCKTQWDAFPEDVRQALREAAGEAAAYERALARAGLDGDVSLRLLRERFGRPPEIAQPLDYLRGQGMTVQEPGPGELARFQDATRPVLDEWTQRLGADLVDAARRDMEP